MWNPPPGTPHVLEALFIPRFSSVGRSRGNSSSIKEKGPHQRLDKGVGEIAPAPW